MRTLPLSDTTAFEDHYLICNSCADLVEEADRYVRAMRAAGLELA